MAMVDESQVFVVKRTSEGSLRMPRFDARDCARFDAINGRT